MLEHLHKGCFPDTRVTNGYYLHKAFLDVILFLSSLSIHRKDYFRMLLILSRIFIRVVLHGDGVIEWYYFLLLFRGDLLLFILFDGLLNDVGVLGLSSVVQVLILLKVLVFLILLLRVILCERFRSIT